MNALIHKFLTAPTSDEATAAGNELYNQIEADPETWRAVIEAEITKTRITLSLLEDMRTQAEAAKFDRVYLVTLQRLGGEL